MGAAFPNGWVTRFGANGQYGYLKPEDEEDLQFVSSADVNGDDWTTIYFPLIETCPFIVFVASVAVAAGRETSVRICSHVEYQTNDSWADVQPSSNLVDSWIDATKILNNVEQFWDNPSHVENLLTRIGVMGQKGLDVAAKGVGAAVSFSNFLGFPVAKAVPALINNITIPTLRRGFRVMEDAGRGNFKGADYDAVKGAIQQMDPRQLFNSYKN
jgi:hypothetical protein